MNPKISRDAIHVVYMIVHFFWKVRNLHTPHVLLTWRAMFKLV